eukprot:CAMPEP_0182857432 /NCGR_PEP_ID=MMETSP0034_2-20130328/3046_1 /TAXON_ID=156128 /ORGANISM="Nephroselmis pyriformis, Strain CCMP717" /LENGTH=266 /DNA_ID=CAMNT_0024988671 /DNA_START=766 /DNA_END=1563 /DNA_ORIENTATION=-
MEFPLAFLIFPFLHVSYISCSRVLYVTTFNRRLYEATGINLLNSFHNHQPDGDLLVAYEDDLPSIIVNTSNILFFNLDSDTYLQSWLTSNKDIIPVEIGGTHQGKFKNIFHSRTSKWFRKIAALHYASSLAYDIIVFLDSDVIFKKHVSHSLISDTFNGTSIFYHFGPFRKLDGVGAETGIIGFELSKKGKLFLNKIFEKYDDGSFKQYKRWDDAWMVTVVLEENPDIEARDLVVRKSRGSRKMKRHVVHDGALASYFDHYKGVHW